DASKPEKGRMIESALVKLGGGEETDKLLAAEVRSSTGATRVHLLTALAKREGAAANPFLLQEINNTDAGAVKAAFYALGKSATERELPRVLKQLGNLSSAEVRSEAEEAAREALGRIEEESRRSTIVRAALREANAVEGRTSLLALLSICADDAALETVEAA